MTERKTAVVTGLAGLLAAILVGVGEFLLHYDPLARYAQGFAFFAAVPESRATLGHFFGVLAAPLYVVGAYHLYLMLRPASPTWAKVAALTMAYGCIVGAVWIGSRATAAMLVNAHGDSAAQLALYELRYENLLTVVRAAVLVLSAIFVWLVWTGRSRYPRWMAALNPILLIAASFLVYLVTPAIGKFVMPIALNVAYLILFTASSIVAVHAFQEGSI